MLPLAQLIYRKNKRQMSSADFALTLPNQSPGALAKVAKLASGSFLRRLKLLQGISQEVQEGKASVREFVLGDAKTNLGREFVCALVGYRMHAIEFVEGKVGAESFDMEDPEFVRIANDAGNWKKGSSAGPEYLIWIPSAEAFGTIHFARGGLDNGTAAGEFVGQFVTLTSELTGNPKKRQWPIPLVKPLIGDATVHDQPSKEEFDAAVKQFNAPTLERKAEDTGRPR